MLREPLSEPGITAQTRGPAGSKPCRPLQKQPTRLGLHLQVSLCVRHAQASPPPKTLSPHPTLGRGHQPLQALSPRGALGTGLPHPAPAACRGAACPQLCLACSLPRPRGSQTPGSQSSLFQGSAAPWLPPARATRGWGSQRGAPKNRAQARESWTCPLAWPCSVCISVGGCELHAPGRALSAPRGAMRGGGHTHHSPGKAAWRSSCGRRAWRRCRSARPPARWTGPCCRPAGGDGVRGARLG